MRISDWSSDVCSSDLRDAAGDEDHERPAGPAPPQVQRDDQRRQRRRASAIILQRVEKRIADRKSVGEGKSVSVRVDLGGRRILKKNKKHIIIHNSSMYPKS